MAEPLLRAVGLTHHFGGVRAVDDISIDFALGEVHAVIGPNGAGKTTLTNLLAGELVPDAGRITLAGRDVAGRSTPQLARLGIGRSFQKTNIFPAFTVFENCRLAAQSRDRRRWRPWVRAAGMVEADTTAARVLRVVGLEAREDELAAGLSHGEQRQLEIAMCLATSPRMLLLDEPLAGMAAIESQRMVELIRELARDHAIMLIEHDLDAVFALADRLTVMAEGRVIASGAPDRVRGDPVVSLAYLGSSGTLAEFSPAGS